LGVLGIDMPFIHVRSLPFKPALEVNAVVEGVTKDFARGTGIGLEHVMATWEFLPSGHYAVAGKASSHQPEESHPVLVDLLSPAFNSAEEIEKMLRTVATSISKRAKVPIAVPAWVIYKIRHA
jgi:phenylpyruvate tautomerase PptA (4-oxalocrotonate tautomerase family)